MVMEILQDPFGRAETWRLSAETPRQGQRRLPKAVDQTIPRLPISLLDGPYRQIAVGPRLKKQRLGNDLETSIAGPTGAKRQQLASTAIGLVTDRPLKVVPKEEIEERLAEKEAPKIRTSHTLSEASAEVACIYKGLVKSTVVRLPTSPLQETEIDGQMRQRPVVPPSVSRLIRSRKNRPIGETQVLAMVLLQALM